MLLSKLWCYDFYGDERVVDSHIKNLRHKLSEAGATIEIRAVYGFGYKLVTTTADE